MSLLDAPQYDAARDRQRRRLAIVLVILLVLSTIPMFLFWNWRQERIVNRFFEAVERQDYETAYAVKFHDPNWKDHIEKYQDYPLSALVRDWGPSGDWGKITKHKIDCSTHAPKGGSGVIVVVTVNDHKEPARMWVEDKDQTLTDSPVPLLCPHLFGN